MLPNVGTNSPQQNQVVSDVRALTAHFAKQNGFEAAAGGAAGELVDYKNSMDARVPLIILALCGITYVLLVPILRSVILPAIAVILNALTVTVAMGIVTLFSVNGVLASQAPIGGAGSPDIVAITAVFCVIFALSIDYYVFLLTRMREEYVRTQSNSQAVMFGIERTGRIVTGAAAIMVATFFAFALSNFTIVRELGIGLCSAILIDATLVRLGLLPAVMRLFGDWTWWMPTWLDQRLPTFDIEGAAFEHEAEQLTGRPVPGGAGFA
jgi:RND superfamily putative drug exporter